MKKKKCVKINCECECIKGKKHFFTKGKMYLVRYLYQTREGDLMVEVKGEGELHYQMYAKRFLIFSV